MAMKKWYQIVTNDKFELPLSEPMRATALARKLGIRPASVRWYSYPSAQKRKEAAKKPYTSHKRKYKIIAFYADLDAEENETEENEKNGK